MNHTNDNTLGGDTAHPTPAPIHALRIAAFFLLLALCTGCSITATIDADNGVSFGVRADWE